MATASAVGWFESIVWTIASTIIRSGAKAGVLSARLGTFMEIRLRAMTWARSNRVFMGEVPVTSSMSLAKNIYRQWKRANQSHQEESPTNGLSLVIVEFA